MALHQSSAFVRVAYGVTVCLLPALILGFGQTERTVPFGDVGTAAQAGEGVYTEAQARRGQELYAKHCAVCHGTRLEGGGDEFAALKGESFMTKWGKGNITVDDLFYIVRTQMPYGDAGTLSREAYIDIISFLLEQNGFPPGPEELSTDAQHLKSILIVSASKG